LPIKPSFLLAVCNAVGTSEKYASNMPEGHWVSAGMSMMKHWLHPYLVVMRPSSVLLQSIVIYHYESVLGQLRAAALWCFQKSFSDLGGE
jgi:hypothetical protein